MIDLAAIDDLARRLSNLVPPGMSQARDDLEQNIKATLQMSLRKLELVIREEFDVRIAGDHMVVGDHKAILCDDNP